MTLLSVRLSQLHELLQLCSRTGVNSHAVNLVDHHLHCWWKLQTHASSLSLSNASSTYISTDASRRKRRGRTGRSTAASNVRHRRVWRVVQRFTGTRHRRRHSHGPGTSEWFWFGQAHLLHLVVAKDFGKKNAKHKATPKRRWGSWIW